MAGLYGLHCRASLLGITVVLSLYFALFSFTKVFLNVVLKAARAVIRNDLTDFSWRCDDEYRRGRVHT